MDELARRLLRIWASSAAAQAEALAAADPSWESELHRVAGGWLVLSGAGMYVNRAMAAGVDSELSNADLDLIVTRSEAVGVSPAVEITPATSPGTLDLLLAKGFVHDREADVTALTRTLTDAPVEGPNDVFVRAVTSDADLLVWQETTARGWGHNSPEARRASDAFTIAAATTDQEDMVLAYGWGDETPIGCASTTIRDGLATLGAMSTLPEHRRRGVHAALLRYRLARAAEQGCDVASTTASSGGRSERNLQRHGFVRQFTIATYTLG